MAHHFPQVETMILQMTLPKAVPCRWRFRRHLPNPTLESIKGKPISGNMPNTGEVLLNGMVWNGLPLLISQAQWVAMQMA